MLVDVLRTGRFIPPYKEARWYSKSHGPVNYAEKITPAHRRVDFSTATAQEILTRHRVLGSLWFSYRKERFIIDEIRVLGADDQPDRNPGDFAHGEDKTVVARTTDGQLMEIQRSTCAGGKVFHGNSTLRRRIREASDEQERTAAKAAAAIAS
jgi:methionyl-tRNA formyltransferase